jgi:hypothetical protein
VNVTPSKIPSTAPSHVLCSGLVTRSESVAEVSSALDRTVAADVRTTSGNDLGLPATLAQPTGGAVRLRRVLLTKGQLHEASDDPNCTVSLL